MPAEPPEPAVAAAAAGGGVVPEVKDQNLDSKNGDSDVFIKEGDEPVKRRGRGRPKKQVFAGGAAAETPKSRGRGRTKKPDAAAGTGEHPSYQCPFQDEQRGGFAASELVWGKVRSHPWWPGQVFDLADASELAVKHRRKDSLLIAYFADKTFAWNDASVLHPFGAGFPQMAWQSKMDAFLSAVDAALAEVARRTELALSCQCSDNEAVKKQEFENAGIREGVSGPVVDASFVRDSFRPEKFLGYITELGELPMAGADRLDLVIAKAQLKAFNRLRGILSLPEFVISGGLVDEAEGSPAKRKRLEQDDCNDTSLGGPGDAVFGKEKSRRRKSSASKKEHISQDGKGLEKDDGGDISAAEASKAVSGREKKSRHREISTRKSEQIPEDGKRLEKDDMSTVGASNAVYGRGKRSRHRESSACKKELFSEDGKLSEKDDGGDISAGEDSNAVSDKEKKPRRTESSADRKGHISEDGRKKKKLSELMEENDSHNSAVVRKSKPRGRGSSRVLAQKHEDPCRDAKASAKSAKKKRLDNLGDVESMSRSCQKYTKVGELMRRAAGQMSQTPPIVKVNGAATQESSRKAKRRRGANTDGSPASIKRTGKTGKERRHVLKECASSCSEMLSQFCLAARDPLKGYSFVPTIVSFFTDFKESYASDTLDNKELSEKVTSKRGRKKSAKMESAHSKLDSSDHMPDSYWSDLVINEDPAEEPVSSHQKKKSENKGGKSKKAKQDEEPLEELLAPPACPVSDNAPNLPGGSAGSVGNGEELKAETEQGSDNEEEPKAEIKQGPGNGEESNAEINAISDKCEELKAESNPVEEIEECLPTGLVLSFDGPTAIPSESDLIRIFSQYGPLKEGETTIAKNANCAQVVFKRRTDAEEAFNGAGKLSALRPSLVSYRLSYLPSAASNEPPQGTSQNEKDPPPVQAVH